MDYTIIKDSVIFEVPLSDYLGKRSTYKIDYITKERFRSEKRINSLQEYEEYLFDSFSYNYIPSSGLYDNEEKKDEAIKYLKSLPAKYTDEELAMQDDELEQAIASACYSVYCSNYEDEWFKKYRKLLQEQIDNDFSDSDGISFDILDRVDASDYFKTRAESDHIRIAVKKSDIKQWLKENYKDDGFHKLPDYIDYFHDYYMDSIDIKEVDTKYIDYYGTLGSDDGWMDYFKDYEEISTSIDKYRANELAKINSQELASLNLKPELQAIQEYTDKYITDKQANEKITRQIKALKGVIKTAL